VSIIFHHVVDSDGVIALNVGTGTPSPATLSQGLLLDDVGAVYATTTDPISYYAYGLPFSVDGRLVVEEGAVDYISQSLPFTANNALSMTNDTGSGGYITQGIRFEDSGALAGSGLTPATPPSNGLIYSRQANGSTIDYRLDTDPYTNVDYIPDNVEGSSYACDWRQGYFALGAQSTEPVQVWQTNTFPFTKLTPPANLGTRIISVKVSGLGNRLLAATEGALTNRIYNSLPDLSIFADTDLFASNAAAFSKVSDLWCAIGGPGNPFLQVWDLSASPKLQAPYTNWPNQPVFAMDTGTSGEYLLAGGDNAPRLWNMADGTDYGAVAGTFGRVRKIAINNSETRCAIYDASAGLRIFDCTDFLNPGNWTTVSLNNGIAWVDDTRYGGLAFSRDDTLLAAVESNGLVTHFVYDMTLNPIDRIQNFAANTNSNYNGACFIDDIPLP
jgi:WD40 repeat protein